MITAREIFEQGWHSSEREEIADYFGIQDDMMDELIDELQLIEDYEY